MIYGLMLYRSAISKSRTFKIQVVCIVASSIMGIVLSFFPMDRLGEPITTNGMIHFILNGIMIPLTMLGCFLGLWVFKESKKMSLFSLIICIVIFICNGIVAFLMINTMNGTGLFQRIAIGLYIIWLLVTSIYYANKL